MAFPRTFVMLFIVVAALVIQSSVAGDEKPESRTFFSLNFSFSSCGKMLAAFSTTVPFQSSLCKTWLHSLTTSDLLKVKRECEIQMTNPLYSLFVPNNFKSIWEFCKAESECRENTATETTTKEPATTTASGTAAPMKAETDPTTPPTTAPTSASTPAPTTTIASPTTPASTPSTTSATASEDTTTVAPTASEDPSTSTVAP